VQGPDLDELAAERPDRQVDVVGRSDLARLPAAGDDQRFGVECPCVSSLSHLHPTLGRAPDELPRGGGRVGHAVLTADHGAEHIVDAQAVDLGGVAVLDRDAERALKLGAFLQACEPFGCRRREHVPDLTEELGAERPEERDRGLRQAHLRCGRELLPHAAHRAPRRSRRNLADVAEDDVARAALREVIRDRRADRAGSGYDDASSHASSSVRSLCDSCLSGQRTSD
jgi:hypothetical protein